MHQDVPVIPYAEHPAFCAYAHESAELETERLARDLNTQLAGSLRAMRDADPRETAATLKDGIRTIAERLDARFEDPEFRRFLTLFQESFTQAADRFCHIAHVQGQGRSGPMTLQAREMTDRLAQHGFVPLMVDTEDLQGLNSALHDVRFEMLTWHAEQPAPDLRIDLSADRPFMEDMAQFLEAVLVLPAARAYRRLPLYLQSCTIGLATPYAGGTARPRYADCGLGAPVTSAIHFDDEAETIRALLYLDPVEAETGPLSYVEGSHAWARDPLGFLTSKVIEDLGHTNPSGRHLLANPAARRYFLRLPRALRHVARLGDDFLDGDYEADRLLRSEHVFLSDHSNFIVYDGGFGMHRLARPTAGVRWTLEFEMRPDA